MSDTATNLVEVTNDVQFVYVTIPAEYLCVYHKILVLLADYGIEMLKDCKASCTDRNSGVIECFNMFNAAVAAYKLNNTSLANTLITYVKAKIEQIYKGRVDTTFVFPLDEDNNIRSFVSCEETIKLFINPLDNELFANTFDDDGNIQQQFIIDTKDEEKPFIKRGASCPCRAQPRGMQKGVHYAFHAHPLVFHRSLRPGNQSHVQLQLVGEHRR